MQQTLKQKLKGLTTELLIHQLTLDNVSAYIYMKDLQGRYTYANKKVRDLFNFALEEIIGYDDSKFFSIDMSNELMINDQLVMNTGNSIQKEERNVIKETGEVRYYWTVKKPVLDGDNNVIGLSGISTDITEQKLLQIELHEKQVLLDTIINNVDAYIYMKDTEHKFKFINEKTASLFGISSHEAIGKRSRDILPKDIADNFDILDSQIFSTGEKVEGEESIINENGEITYYWSTKVPIKDESGRVISFIGFSTDITKITEQKNEFKKQAHTDELTKLANRRMFMDNAFNHYIQAKRNKTAICIMMIDVDLFKSFNDLYGHNIGDIVLKKMANVFLSSIRKNDVVARIGGEEFVILLPETDLSIAIKIAEKSRKKVEDTHLSEIDEHTTPLTISIGVTTMRKNQDSVEKALIRADQALYLAKESGRNQVQSK